MAPVTMEVPLRRLEEPKHLLAGAAKEKQPEKPQEGSVDDNTGIQKKSRADRRRKLKEAIKERKRHGQEEEQQEEGQPQGAKGESKGSKGKGKNKKGQGKKGGQRPPHSKVRLLPQHLARKNWHHSWTNNPSGRKGWGTPPWGY